MRRFILDSGPATPGDRVRLSGAEAHHARDVLRLGVKDKVLLVDGRGGEYPAQILSLDSRGIDLVILEAGRSGNEPDFSLTLGLALLKSDNMDLVVQKGTELGLARLIPLNTERTTVRLQDQRVEKKIRRWRDISQQAVKQCRRGCVPEIGPVMDLDDFLGEPGTDELRIMLYEARRGKKSPWEETLARAAGTGRATVLVGPEGGFTDKEAEKALAAKFLPFSFGPRIMRAETAALAIISILMFELGDLK